MPYAALLQTWAFINNTLGGLCASAQVLSDTDLYSTHVRSTTRRPRVCCKLRINYVKYTLLHKPRLYVSHNKLESICIRIHCWRATAKGAILFTIRQTLCYKSGEREVRCQINSTPRGRHRTEGRPSTLYTIGVCDNATRRRPPIPSMYYYTILIWNARRRHERTSRRQRVSDIRFETTNITASVPFQCSI